MHIPSAWVLWKRSLRETSQTVGGFTTFYLVARLIVINGAVLFLGILGVVFWDTFNPIARALAIAVLVIQPLRLVLFIRELRSDYLAGGLAR